MRADCGTHTKKQILSLNEVKMKKSSLEKEKLALEFSKYSVTFTTYDFVFPILVTETMLVPSLL